MPVFRVEKTKNYTTMSNYHLRDKNLSLKSKGLLSLMLSLPEDWDYTLFGLAYICKDGIDSVRASIKELEAMCYLSKNRTRNEKGQLTDTEYTIFEKPQPTLEKPTLEKPILDNPTLGKPILEKPMQINTYIQIKEKQNTEVNNQSIYQSKMPIPTENDDSIDRIDFYRKIILDNIEYGVISCQLDKERLDELVEIMVECICAKSDTIRISKENVPQEVVKSRFLKINSEHIDYIMDCLSKNTTKIYNIKEYLKTALYNSTLTIGSYYTAEVNHDLYGGGR